jgi:hypothetical protein
MPFQVLDQVISGTVFVRGGEGQLPDGRLFFAVEY